MKPSANPPGALSAAFSELIGDLPLPLRKVAQKALESQMDVFSEIPSDVQQEIAGVVSSLLDDER